MELRSEFETLDRDDITQAFERSFEQYLNGEGNYRELLLKELNSAIRETNSKYSCLSSDFIKEIKENIKRLKLPNIDEVESSFSSFLNKLHELLVAMDVDKELPQKYKSENYLFYFVNAMQRTIFNPNKNYLNSDSMLHETMIDFLTLLAKKNPDIKEEIKSNNPRYNYYHLSVFDPFFYSALIHSIAYSEYIIKQMEKEPRILQSLRFRVFLDEMQNGFRRISIFDRDNKEHQVKLNQHDTSLYAIPYSHLSSIEEVKPLVLFEKMAMYIRKNMHLKSGNFQFYIVGHTEPSIIKKDGKIEYVESGLMDLCSAILNWYDGLPEIIDGLPKPKLNLNVTNIISELDGPSSNLIEGNKRVEKFTLAINGEGSEIIAVEDGKKITTSKVKCEIKPSSQYRFFDLLDPIEMGDVSFYLDCPWFQIENENIVKSGSMQSYSILLQQISSDPLPKTYDDDSIFWKSALLSRMNYNLTRILGGFDKKDAGEITRVLYDDKLSKYRDSIMANKTQNQEIHFYTSDREAPNYSIIGFHPFTRKELYGGKQYTVISYNNYNQQKRILHSKSDNLEFNLSIWDLLKGISMSFLYVEMKDLIKSCLNNDIDYKLHNPIGYFELYRNIFVNLDVSENYKNVRASVWLDDDNVDKCLKSTIGYTGDIELAKQRIKEEVSKLVEPLMQRIFIGSEKFGDPTFKSSFYNGIYNLSDNVKKILFCQTYLDRTRYYKDSKNVLHEFKMKLNSDFKKSVLSDSSSYCYSDIYLYSHILEGLKCLNMGLPLGIRSLITESEKIFGDGAGDDEDFLNIIMRAAEEAKDERLVERVKECIRQREKYYG